MKSGRFVSGTARRRGSFPMAAPSCAMRDGPVTALRSCSKPMPADSSTSPSGGVTDPVLRPFFSEAAARAEAQWSSDGRSLAYLSAGAVWIAGANGEKPRRVVAPGLGAGLRGLRWSPDGQSILFITDLHGDWDVGVYSLASDQWSLITSGPWEELDASWSNDGRRVAFVSTQRFDKRLGVFDIASGKVDYISPEGAVASSPLWSPVNHVLAYVQQHASTAAATVAVRQRRAPAAHPAARAPREGCALRRRNLTTTRAARDYLCPALLYKPADFRPEPVIRHHGHPWRLRWSVGQRL